MANDDFEAAIGLYFEIGPTSGGAQQQASNTAATANRQSADPFGIGGGGGAGGGADYDDIRAPIQPQRTTLAFDDSGDYGGDYGGYDFGRGGGGGRGRGRGSRGGFGGFGAGDFGFDDEGNDPELEMALNMSRGDAGGGGGGDVGSGREHGADSTRSALRGMYDDFGETHDGSRRMDPGSVVEIGSGDDDNHNEYADDPVDVLAALETAGGISGASNLPMSRTGTSSSATAPAFAASAAAAAAAAAAPKSKFDELFEPPADLLHNAPLDTLLGWAKGQQKYAIVNLQDPTIFQCQVLNRDLWKDKRVRELIENSFLLTQYQIGSADYSNYVSLYGAVDVLPHIAILHHQTRARVAIVPQRAHQPDQFIDFLYDFLGGASTAYGAATQPPQPQRQAAGESARTENVRSDDLEQRMLEEAIAASLRDAEENQLKAEPIVVDSDVDDAANKAQSAIAASTAPAAAAPSSHWFDSIPATLLPSDTKPGPDATRIQVQFGDGARSTLVIRKDAHVRDILSHVRSMVIERAANSAEMEKQLSTTDCIELHFQAARGAKTTTRLSKMLDSTVTEAGLTMASLRVEVLGRDEEYD
ncbi:hypothetical protein GQ42DRAFT_162395 [Ramicandelaber brevisporus]|nr:hypothetical protein GQ42DRAFT_162395 [Ramicandelaber brevisporus]